MWEGATNGGRSGGYGYVRVGGRGTPMVRVHRLVYEWVRGPLHPKDTLDHLCHNRRCANPYHLRVLDRVEHGVVSTDHQWATYRETGNEEWAY